MTDSLYKITKINDYKMSYYLISFRSKKSLYSRYKINYVINYDRLILMKHPIFLLQNVPFEFDYKGFFSDFVY